MTANDTTAMVGPYQVQHLIGRGGMGEVFRAFDTRRQRTVALKLLPLALSEDPQYRERFRRESLAAAALASPHIVPIHDFGEVDGRLFIDMRLINGTDLATRFAGEAVEPEKAVDILTQIAEALDDAHAHGIVHRDVKPSNVLLTDTDFAYLVDFGIASSPTAGTSLTGTGNTIGTWGYMAPERFDGRPACPRSDTYSLGCVAHELLTGRRPFSEHQSTPSLIRAHLMLEPEPPSASRADLSPGLDQAVLKAMAKDPDDRHSSTIEFSRAMRGALDPTGTGVPARAPIATRFTSFASNSGNLSAPAGVSAHTEDRSPAPVPDATRVQPSSGRRVRPLVLTAAAIALIGTGVVIGTSATANRPTAAPEGASSSTSRTITPSVLFGAQNAQPPIGFGEGQSFDPGITLTAASPRPFQPSSSAAGGRGAARVVRVDVTIKNDTSHYINFSERLTPTLKIDGARTTPILDFATGVGSVSSDAVAPGGSTTFAVAWALPQNFVPIQLELGPVGLNSGSRITWQGEA